MQQFPIPARITGLKTAAEISELRDETAASDLADQHKATVEAYGGREVDYTKRHEQDSMALFYALGGIEHYLRTGGDPRVAVIIQTALNFAEQH